MNIYIKAEEARKHDEATLAMVIEELASLVIKDDEELVKNILDEAGIVYE